MFATFLVCVLKPSPSSECVVAKNAQWQTLVLEDPSIFCLLAFLSSHKHKTYNQLRKTTLVFVLPSYSKSRQSLSYRPCNVIEMAQMMFESKGNEPQSGLGLLNAYLCKLINPDAFRLLEGISEYSAVNLSTGVFSF